MNAFRVTKLVATSELDAFVKFVNVLGEGFVERETAVGTDFWLLCVACADRDLMLRVRQWSPSCNEPASSAQYVGQKS